MQNIQFAEKLKFRSSNIYVPVLKNSDEEKKIFEFRPETDCDSISLHIPTKFRNSAFNTNLIFFGYITNETIGREGAAL